MENPTILIVDDAPENITILGEVLSDYNLKVTTNGAKALEIINSGTKIDMILLDVVMPGIDGFEVAKTIKENPVHSNIPIIFVTGEKDVNSFIHGFELGAEDYITKPFDANVVKAAVERKLGGTQSN